MTSRTLPGIGLQGFWGLGENGWNSGMDTNLQLLSALTQLTVQSASASLPGSPSDGYIAIVPSGADANKIAVRDNGAWVYFVPITGWGAVVVDTLQYLVWNGAAWQDFSILYAKANQTLAKGTKSTAMRAVISTSDITLSSGTFVQTSSPNGAPDHSLLLGFGVRVLTTVTGTTSLVAGVSGGAYDNTYGTGIALTAGTTYFAHVFSPISYTWGGYALPGIGVANSLTDAFTAGVVRISCYSLVCDLPDNT